MRNNRELPQNAAANLTLLFMEACLLVTLCGPFQQLANEINSENPWEKYSDKKFGTRSSQLKKAAIDSKGFEVCNLMEADQLQRLKKA